MVEFGILISPSPLVIFLFKMPKGTSPKQGLENSCKIARKCLKASELPSRGLRNATSGAVLQGTGGLEEVSLVPVPPQGRSCRGDTERARLRCEGGLDGLGQACPANLETDGAAGMRVAGDAGQGCPQRVAPLPVPRLVTKLRELKSFQAPHLHLTAPHSTSSSSVLKYPSRNLGQT